MSNIPCRATYYDTGYCLKNLSSPLPKIETSVLQLVYVEGVYLESQWLKIMGYTFNQLSASGYSDLSFWAT